MKLTRFHVLGVLPLVAIAYSLHRLGGGGLDEAAYQRAADRIYSMQQLEVSVSEATLRLRYGREKNYDSVTRALNAIDEHVTALGADLHDAHDRGGEEVAELLGTYREEFEKKKARIVAFSADNATLVNSLRVLPRLVQRVQDAAADRPEAAAVSASCQAVLTDALLFDNAATEDRESQLAKSLRDLEGREPGPSKLEPLVSAVAGHARIVLAGRRGIDEGVDDITRVPTLARLQGLAGASHASYELQAAEVVRDRWLLLGACGVPLASPSPSSSATRKPSYAPVPSDWREDGA